jgi:hypothetical protein
MISVFCNVYKLNPHHRSKLGIASRRERTDVFVEVLGSAPASEGVRVGVYQKEALVVGSNGCRAIE